MKSRAARILIGAGIGCGAVIVVVIIAFVSFAIWLQGAGELLEPRSLLAPDTAGYAEWTLRLEDEGTARFVEELVARLGELQRQGNQSLPGPLGPLMSNLQTRNNERAFRELFPLVAVWAMRPAPEPGGADAHVFSVSVERLGHRIAFADWLMARFYPDDETVRHAGERIYLPAGMSGRAFFLHGSEAVIASDLDAARAAAERLGGGGTERPGDLGSILDTTERRPFRMAISNDGGLVETLWPGDPVAVGPDAERLAWSEVATVVAAGGLEGSAFNLDLEVRFERQPTAAEAAALGDGLRSWLEGSGVEAQVDDRVAGRAVWLSVTIADALAALDSALDDTTNAARAPDPGSG